MSTSVFEIDCWLFIWIDHRCSSRSPKTIARRKPNVAVDVQDIRHAPAHARRLYLFDRLKLLIVVEVDDTRSHDHKEFGAFFGLTIESEEYASQWNIS